MIAKSLRRTIAVWTAPLMFWLALAFLVCQAVLVVLWVDVPNLSQTASAATELSTSSTVSTTVRPSGLLYHPTTGEVRIQNNVLRLMMVIWPMVIFESIFHWLTRTWSKSNRWFHFYALLFCVCPSLRMCARSLEVDRKMWLPGLGWRRADKRLRRRLERTFSLPMIAIALLILPVLIIEFFMKAQVAKYAWLRLALHVSTGVIWFAFAAEFILMISVARKKLDYIRRNWIDLAIILLPLLSFMRSLQLMRSTKLAKLIRVSQLSRMASVYRLRATAIKALRALVLLDVVERLVRIDPQRQIDRMREELRQRELECRVLRRDLYRAETELAKHQQIEEQLAQEQVAQSNHDVQSGCCELSDQS